MQAAKPLSAPEVAQLLGVSVQTLAVWRCEQRYPLPYVKVGSRVRYRPCDVEQFMNARLNTPGQG
jgi:predicted DNA-binding transcriptional regulator AlpA